MNDFPKVQTPKRRIVLELFWLRNDQFIIRYMCAKEISDNQSISFIWPW